MKKLFFTTTLMLSALLFSIVPTITSAHVKWFVDSPEIIQSTHNTIPFYNVTSIEVIVWSILIGVVVLLCSLFDRWIPTSKKFLFFVYKKETQITRIAQGILGLFLISVSLLWNIIIIPEIPAEGTFGLIAKIIQIGVGCLFITNIFPRLAASTLAIATLTLGYTHGIATLAEQSILLSLAVFFYIKASPSDSWWNKLDKHAVEIVRIGTGVTLIVLAFTEKLMYPELSVAFLDVYQWNFMQSIFPWFTNNLFVLSTGFAELTFGILFILGYLTRINTVILSGFFAASVVTMFVQFGAWEVEDLVVYSAAILLVCYGHGKTKFFHMVWPNSWLHKKIL